MNDSFEISGNIVDLINETIFSGTLTIEKGKISKITKSRKVYKNYILPGFIDAHVHIESSMLPPSEFARLASPHGTIATVSDPHEIANVMGLDGVLWMIENAKTVPFKFYFGAPSCVPATDFETSGAYVTAKDIEWLFNKFDLKYLSEMMNYPGVLFENTEVMEKIQIAKKYKKPIDGHAPGLIGEECRKYINAGITTDHECYTLEEAREKIKYGMKILIREGSAAKNFETLAPLIEENPEMLMFCTDDSHPDTLINQHIRDVVIRSFDLGYDLMNVLKIACVNPVKHYNLDVGLLQKGDPADFILVNNFQDFNVLQVFVDGKLIAENGKTAIKHQKVKPINKFVTEFKSETDFVLPVKKGYYPVITAIDGELITERFEYNITKSIKDFEPDIQNDILKIAVINRYQNSKPAIALIKNFGLRKGAIATSVAHDSHNIIAVGVDNKSLLKVVNAIIENKGGMAVYNGENIEVLPLPVAGLLATDKGEAVAKQYSNLQKLVKNLGSNLTSPFMTLSFMALLVIPKIKLSDKGLFDGEKFEFIKI